MTTIKTTVYLDSSDYRRLKSMADHQGRSAAALVREAVAQYTTRGWERPWPRSVGMAKSGIPDLAENYEDYMDGFGEEELDYDGIAPSPRSAGEGRRTMGNYR